MAESEYLAFRRAGILDVAARAGVSRQTVTRAMNDMSGIREDTKQRVLQAAKELQYRPSRFGRGLVTKATPILGLIVVDLTNSYWAELASAVLDAARRQDWTVLIAESAHGGAGITEALVSQVDAVIGHVEIDEDELDAVFGAVPLVLLERAPGPATRAVVYSDFGPPIDAAVDHLVATGRTRLAMLDWSLTGTPSARGLAFSESLRARGIEPRVHMTSTDADPTIESARRATTEAVLLWPETDAFLCFNDVVAVGAIKQLTADGVMVPTRVAVVGIDGLSLGRVVSPELTTLSVDLPSVAEVAVDLVIRIAAGDAPIRGPEVQVMIQHQLVIRDSS